MLPLLLYRAFFYCMHVVFSCFRVPTSLLNHIDRIQFLEQIMNRKCQRGTVNTMLRFRFFKKGLFTLKMTNFPVLHD